MFLKKILIPDFKILKNVEINFNKTENHNVFPIISYNGGGKSTLIQYVFGLLNLSFDSSKHKYLRNLLSYFDNVESECLTNIASFTLEYENDHTNINFYITRNTYQNFDFNIYNKIKDINELYLKNNESINDYELLNRLENDYTNSNMSTEVLYHELKKFMTSAREEEIIRRGDLNTIKRYILKFKRKIEHSILENESINKSLLIAETELKKLNSGLKKHNLEYLLHFKDNEFVLLVESNKDIKELKKISSFIYLASPKTQVMHFLDNEEINSLFKLEKYFYTSYDRFITNSQDDIKEYFTYDFNAINLIVKAFQKARDNDFKKALETGKYGDEISESFKELNNLLENKKINFDNEIKNLNFKNDQGKILFPSDLSHGELKKLSIYIWVKANVKDNSIVFFDEIDMGLHPKWQQDIYKDLQIWNKTSQYFLATHSPQIISNCYYKNLAVLDNNKTFSTIRQFEEAPIDSDLNSIVKTIMGSEYTPTHLQLLKAKYREFFDANNENSDAAVKIKDEILKFESYNSLFFQDIELNKLLR